MYQHQIDRASGAAALSAISFRIVIFTCRDEKTDFRLPLAQALREEHEVLYIWLRRRPRVSRLAPESAGVDMSFPALISLLWRVTRAGKANIYFNSTNTSFPVTMVLLRLICGSGIWFLDMHDDLVYDKKGLERVQATIAVKLQEWAADVILRSAESLAELFPKSLSFGNASQIRSIDRDHCNYRSVLVLASLDWRFDFELMAAAALASPGTRFDIYGQISEGDATVGALLADLCQSHVNVVYHGAYALCDLEGILKRYAVSFAPYQTNTRLTRYLDPLRFYHCLNSGMELITTDIPQARLLRSSLHLVRDAAELQQTLLRLETEPSARRNTRSTYQPRTWEQRAQRLIAIATAARGKARGGYTSQV